MKIMKLILVFICSVLVMFGISYRLTVWPFSSPMIDLISWALIGIAFIVLFVISKN